tara:strand:- start:202 stop:441 length:240 start_codon:yes stop_codon:yes gene_type:complete
MADLSKSETKLLMLRNVRNQLLEKSDWTQINDSQLSTDKKTEWQKYRQELRDITKKFVSMDEKDENGNDTGFKFPDKPK